VLQHEYSETNSGVIVCTCADLKSLRALLTVWLIAAEASFAIVISRSAPEYLTRLNYGVVAVKVKSKRVKNK